MTSQMIAAAQRTIVVADSSKFAKKSFTRIGPLGSMQVLITDKEPPDDLAQALNEAQVEVIIAPREFDGSAQLRKRYPNLFSVVKPFPSPQPNNVISTTTKPNGTHNRAGNGFAAP